MSLRRDGMGDGGTVAATTEANVRCGIASLFLHLADAGPLPLLSTWSGAALLRGRGRRRRSVDGVDVDQTQGHGRL